MSAPMTGSVPKLLSEARRVANERWPVGSKRDKQTIEGDSAQAVRFRQGAKWMYDKIMEEQ